MRLVIVESPYAGDVERNVAYARAAMADCLARGEAPIASHLLYTQPGVLNDNEPDERRLGIDAGLAWANAADAIAFYTDLGVSPGMHAALGDHMSMGRPIEYRTLPGWGVKPANDDTPRRWTWAEVDALGADKGFLPTAYWPAEPQPSAHAQFKRRAANDGPTDAELIAQAWGWEAVA